MNQRIATTFAAALLLGFSAPVALAGAWLQKQGSRYAKLYGSYLYTEREFNAAGQKVDILSDQDDVSDTAFRDVTIAGYLEYGVHEDLTLTAKVPFRILTSRRTEIANLADLRYNVEAVNGGLGDLELGGRIPLLRAPFPVSFQLGIKLPLGYQAQPTNGGAALGSGSPDFEARLLWGISLYPYGYFGAELGYRAQGGDIDDQMNVVLEGGTGWRRVRMATKFNASFSAGSIEQLTDSSTKRVTNYEAMQIIPSVAVVLTPRISLVGEAFHTLDGKNTSVGTAWAIGVEIIQ